MIIKRSIDYFGFVAADPSLERLPDQCPDATAPAAAPSQVDLGFRSAGLRCAGWCGVLVLVLAAATVWSLFTGAAHLAAGDVFRALVTYLTGYGDAPEQALRIMNTRLPRVVLSALVGAGLAVAGVVLQALVRNPLADPYTVGVNSGATCGAAGAIVLGWGAGLGLQAVAFLGALAAGVIVLLIGRAGGALTGVRVILAGVAVGYALSAVTSLLVFSSDSPENARSVLFWTLGSLGLARWNAALALTAMVVALCAVVFWLAGPRLDALSVGDATATSLGIDPQRLRAVAVALVCLLVGVVVSQAGSIGFVGLVVPHVLRRAVGGTHRHLLPAAALGGAVLLVLSDTVARTIVAPQELPVGIITALVGTPALLLLVYRLYQPAASRPTLRNS